MSQAADRQELLNRLTSFCGMLGDDLTNLDAPLVTRIENNIRRLSNPTKVAIAGLTRGDHRSLAEFFLGVDVFSGLTATDACPEIQVRFAAKPATHALYDSERRSFDGYAIAEAIRHGSPKAIELEIPNPIASEIGFAILPSYEAEENPTRYLADLLQDTAVIVWCSDVSNFWLPQERHLWTSIPDQMKARSILALTGADQPSSAGASALFGEKRGLVDGDFHKVLTISVDGAKISAPQGQVGDSAGFTSSGGQRLLKTLMELVKIGQSDSVAQARQLITDLDTLSLGSAQPVPENIKADAAAGPDHDAVALEPSRDGVRAFLLSSSASCTVALRNCGDDGFAPLFDEFIALLAGLSRFADDGLDLGAEHDLMMKQVDEANDLIGLLGYEDNEAAALEASDVARQISIEYWTRIQSRTANDDTLILSEFEQGSAVG